MPPKLVCTKLSPHLHNAGLTAISTVLDGLQQSNIGNAPWGIKGQMPDVRFALAYDDISVFLKYTVAEPAVRAEVKDVNGPVYEDSCIEFFIAFGDDGAYYNFEFNSLGVCLAGFGSGKQRQVFPVDAIAKINALTTGAQQNKKTGLYHWSVAVQIPFEVFIHHQIKSLQGQSARVNFYKCGDLLPNLHFLTWAPMEHPFPEFHLPQFFGELVFV